jgi:Ser-tRNA(Ala) deacylase AlaX
MNVAAQIARRDFSSKTLRSLSKKGIALVGTQLIPHPVTGWINADRGYVVDDNGTGRVWDFRQVMSAA